MGKPVILACSSHLVFSSGWLQFSSKSKPLLGPPTVTRFLTGIWRSQLSTINLPIKLPWLRPRILNYCLPKISCRFILLHASSHYLFKVVNTDEILPSPISMHSTWAFVPSATFETSLVSKSSLHSCLIPWKITVGIGSVRFGPSLVLGSNFVKTFFLDFFLSWAIDYVYYGTADYDFYWSLSYSILFYCAWPNNMVKLKTRYFFMFFKI